MELDRPTPLFRPPSLGWLPGYTAWCADAIQGKEGGIQVLAGLAPSSQTVGSNKRVIHLPQKLQCDIIPYLASLTR
jgi:hypothetical protein